MLEIKQEETNQLAIKVEADSVDANKVKEIAMKEEAEVNI